MASQPPRLATAALVAATVARLASAYVSLPFNQNLFFGPDGPWQGVELGYVYSSDDSDTVNHPVTVLPALANAEAAIYLPTPSSCDAYQGVTCATGGTIEEISNSTTASWFASTDAETGWSYNYTGTYQTVNLTLPNSLDQYFVDALACTDTTGYYPNGKTLPAQVGLYSVGGTTSQDAVSTPKALYAANLIQSNSFGLHYGSVQHQYPGSLIFGGFDPGRIIGPLISTDPGYVELLDITIGVETGGSPFSFTNKTGLLRTSSSQTSAQPLEAFYLPNTPYLYLPKTSVDLITSLLPVTYDSSGYYLWDTADPSYSKIISSPAYLGFEFPLSPGSTSSTIIKLPFSLLNLTLEKSVTGYDSDMPYFPIMAADYTAPSQPIVWLGRAFYQGVYWAANWGNNITWLAQAPGPGANHDGLGTNPQDMASEATNLSVQSGSDLFANSWSGTWTVLASNANASSSGGSGGSNGSSSGDTNNSSSTSSGAGLSGGDIAGIVVGVVVGLAALAIAAFFLYRRRSKYNAAATQDPHEQPPAMEAAHFQGQGQGQESVMPKYGHESIYYQQGQPQQQWSHSQYDPSPYAQASYAVPHELAAPEFNGARELHSEPAPRPELPGGED